MQYFTEFDQEVDKLFTYLIANKIKNYWIHLTLKNHQAKFKDVHLDIITKRADTRKLSYDELILFALTYNKLRCADGSFGTPYTI